MATHRTVPRTASSSSELREIERIYTGEFAFVWRVLRRFGVPHAQLEDAAQDVFLVWVRRRRELVRGGSVRTRLYGIARRVAADARRSAARAQRRTAALAAVADDRDEGFERVVETQDAMAAVDRVLPQLSKIQREAYLLAEVEGMSAREIGAALGISPNTASSRLRLARQQLALALGEQRLAPEEPPAEARQHVWVALLPSLSVRPGVVATLAGLGVGSKVGIAAALAGVVLIAIQPGRPASRPEPTSARAEREATASLRAEPEVATSTRTELAATGSTPTETEAPAHLRGELEASAIGPPGERSPARVEPAASRSTASALDRAREPGVAAGRAAAALSPSEPADLRARAMPPSEASASPSPDSSLATQDAQDARSRSAEDPLAREARQIASARRLLDAGRLDEALAVLDAHAADALHGRLADEREALRAAARCRRGEREAALEAASAWFAGRPNAPALRTAHAMCKL